METSNNVYVNRKFSCSAQELFNWLIQPKLIAKWFGPKHLRTGKVEVNPVVGGKYSIEMVKPDGSIFFIEGNYFEIESPHRLTFSFRYNRLNNSSPESLVIITLEEIHPNLSKLALIQKFESIPPDMDNRTKAWESMFAKLSEEIKRLPTTADI